MGCLPSRKSRLWPLLAGFFIAVASVDLVLPNAAALALKNHGTNAGAAAALLGFGQFLLGGLAAPLVGIRAANDVVPTATVMAGLGTAAVITLVLLGRPRPSQAAGKPTGQAAGTR